MGEPHHYFGPTGIPRLAALWDTPFSNCGVLSYSIFTVVGGAYKPSPVSHVRAASCTFSRQQVTELGVPILPVGVLEAVLGLLSKTSMLGSTAVGLTLQTGWTWPSKP